MAKKKTTNRKPGRPKTCERPIGPAEQDRIAALYLQHSPITSIAAELGVSERTVRHHLDKHVRPVWQASMRSDLEADLAEVDRLAAEAWSRYKNDGKREDLADAKWAIEHRAKIFGFYAAKKHDVRSEDPDARVAGLTPHEYAQRLLGRILEKAEELKRREQALKQRGLN